MVEDSRKQDVAKEEEMRKAIQAGLDELDRGRYITLSDANEISNYISALGERAALTVGSNELPHPL